ncbi:MAG: hypothetical protein LBJ59_01350 [Zoogloeaceae bacterium]|jgi:hypothetical protein|nr:hypothetical protein [Zoogloeaceae bacterium]
MKKILFIVVFVFSNSVLAGILEDESLFARVMQPLGITESDMCAAVEKPLPYDDGLSVVVIPQRVDEEDDEGTSLFFHVLVIDNASLELRARFQERREFDAIGFDRVGIDTANYRLNDQTRAFGVRLHVKNSSSVNPYSSTSLSLFVLDKDKNALRRVLRGFEVSSSSAEWDGTCAGVFFSREGTLAMSRQKTRGFNDIIVKIRNTERVTRLGADGECVDKENRGAAPDMSLKFNGEEYMPEQP